MLEFEFELNLYFQVIILACYADHYTGLRENWDYGPIYCSEVTGKLVVKIVGVSPDLIRPMKWDTPTVVDGNALSKRSRLPSVHAILYKPWLAIASQCGPANEPHISAFTNCT